MITNRTHGLITKGLGLPASKGIITMFFTLFLTPGVTPPIPVNHGGGGGHVPVSTASNFSYNNRGRSVQMRNVPIQSRTVTNVPYYMQRNGERGKLITIKVTLAGEEVKKEYMAMDKDKIKVMVDGLFTQLVDESIKVIAVRLFEQINIKD